MFREVATPLQLFIIAVPTVVWLPSVEGLLAKRYGQPPHVSHQSEFLNYLENAEIPKEEFLYPERKEAEGYPGETGFEDVGKETLTNHPDHYKLFTDVTTVCHDVFRPGSRDSDYYFNVSRPSLQPLLVARSHPDRTDAAVIIAPGGGQNFLAWSKALDFAEVFLRLGINAFILKYRVPTRGFETVSADAQRAVSYVRKNAKRFGLNPARIGFAGFSAGAILTADLSTSTMRAYARIDDVDDESYMPDFAVVGYGAGPSFITPEMHPPPTFTVHAMDDPCVPVEGSLAYCKALKDHGQICDGHYYPGGGHGYGVCLEDVVSAPGRQFPNFEWTGDQICEWPRYMERFLRTEVLGERLAVDAKLVLPHFLDRVRKARILHRSEIAPEDRALDMRTVPRRAPLAS